MTKAFKYKLKPNKTQQEKLSQFFGTCRFIYNWGLDRKIQTYKDSKKAVSYIEIAKELTLLKKQEDMLWLNDTPNVSLQQSLRNLDQAFIRFFREKKGFPKFKAKKKAKDSAKFIDSVHFDFNKWKVKLPKLGWIKLCENKTFNQETCKQGTCTVSRDHCGTYWCVILVETNTPQPSKAKVVEKTAVGVDLGIKDYAILSDGTRYGNPKFLEHGHKKLTKLQRKFARSKKGSQNHEKLRLKIAKCYRHITNQRSDFMHKLSTMLVQQYDTICLEDLNVKGMMKNHHLANSIQSAAWSEFVRQLAYKSEWYGKNVIYIGRFEPSSKMCHKCGFINKNLQLSDREWICPQCGESLDRDVNAALNIKDIALHPQNLVGTEAHKRV